MPSKSIRDLAMECLEDWERPYFGAVPYLEAMQELSGISDYFGQDSARSVIAYFLSNATTWRGPTARRVKAELRELLRAKGPTDQDKQTAFF